MKLFTIGYEGLTLETFFALLIKNHISTLVDVRQMPLSRKKGFSKTALSAAAFDYKIRYTHLNQFGCPKNIRNEYRADKDWERYTRKFTSYLNTQDEVVDNFTHQATSEVCCLLCFEADPNYCHRSLVACRVAQKSPSPLRIIHLTKESNN